MIGFAMCSKPQFLGDCCLLEFGFAFDSSKFNSDGIGVPLVRIRDIKRGSTATYTTEPFDDRYIVKDGDLLIGMDGEFNLIKWSGGNAVLNQRVCRIRSNDPGLLDDFLGLFLSKELKKIEAVTSKVTVKHLSAKKLKQIEIATPAPSEQKRIVSEIEAVDAMVRCSKAAILRLDDLVKSRFNEMFEGVKQPVIAFGDCCIHLRNGANIKQDKGASGIPITRIETLSNGKFNPDKMGFANIFSIDSYAKHRLLPGDILISHINSIAYLGRAVQYRGELGDSPVIHGMNLLSARLKETFSPTYFEWFFKTPQVSKYISSIAKKSVNQASFSVADLKKMPIAIPPISSQLEFATFVQRVDKLRFMLLRNPSPTYRGRSFCCSTNSGNSGVILDA